MLIQYPLVKDDVNAMGVAPHYDSGFLIFVCLLFFLLSVDGPDVPSFSKLPPTVASKSKPSPATGSMSLLSQVPWWSTSGKVPSSHTYSFVTPHSSLRPTALEFVTRGLARATYHRVISPRAAPGEPETARYSVPFFQNFSPDICLADNILECGPPLLLHN